MRYKIDIKKEREKYNLTQAKLASLIGVTEKSVSKWENGRGQPSYENMLKICDVFKLDINKIDVNLIYRKRINNFLNLIFIISNFVVLFITLYQIINIANFKYNVKGINITLHMDFSKLEYKSYDEPRWKFSFVLPSVIAILNAFFYIKSKNISIFASVEIISIICCFIIYNQLLSSSQVFVLVVDVILLIVALFINYKTKGANV